MKKYKRFYSIIICCYLVIIGRIFVLLNNNKYYKEKYDNKTNIYIKGLSAPRGRILDRNNNVIVDNKATYALVYRKKNNPTFKEELEISKILSNYIIVNKPSIMELKKFYLLQNNNGANLITDDEYQSYKERRITDDELLSLKLSRIKNSDLQYKDQELKVIKIYYLMNEGYSYDKKIIVKNLTEEQLLKLSKLNIGGLSIEIMWERLYNYGDVFRSTLGNVGKINLEKKDYYLNLGYDLNDLVGVSYLEEEYESILKGEKAVYKVLNNGKLELVKKEVRGQDLKLNIDINIQMKIESIIKEQLINAKKYPNTEYYNETYAILIKPFTGHIIAFAGIRLNKDNTFTEISINNINESFTMGSSVKAATIAVGYKNNIIDFNTTIMDGCVKLYNKPPKCSFKKLGKLNDLKALEYSSNYFQFQIAIGLTNNIYKPNMVLNATKQHFEIYRNTLKNFGLGEITNIDLPGEKNGIIGSVIADDLLLNLAIGQYDTYTPIQMIKYINSVATGYKINPVLKYNENGLNKEKVDLEDQYLARIRLGLNKVLLSGTGSGFVNKLYNPSGKTGTSESMYDKNNDNIVDTKTITNVFTGYFPSDNPMYSLVVITPNISHENGKNDYKYPASRIITRNITDFLFENY